MLKVFKKKSKEEPAASAPETGSGSSGLNVVQPSAPSGPPPTQIGGGSAPVGIGSSSGDAPSSGLNVVQPSAPSGPPTVQIGGDSSGAPESPFAQAPAAAPSPAPAPTPSGGGRELTRANVEEVLDARVRPGLMSDGGNMEVVDIQDNKVLVKLVGACGTCPSSAMTMQFGIERILKEEFPTLEGIVNLSF